MPTENSVASLTDSTATYYFDSIDEALVMMNNTSQINGDVTLQLLKDVRFERIRPVSYTHLDVYKRQVPRDILFLRVEHNKFCLTNKI